MDLGVRTAFTGTWRAGAIAAGVGAAVTWAGAASAQTPAPGAVLAAPCAACHGTGGASPGAIPSIIGLDAAAMAQRMRDLRLAGNEATVMNRIARGYTDAEIAALAQYFSTQKR